MTHLSIVQSRGVQQTRVLAPEIPPAHTKLSAAQRAKVKQVAAHFATQFHAATVDYFERRASYSAVIESRRDEGVLDSFFDPILQSATFEGVLLDVQTRALDSMRERLRSEAANLLALANGRNATTMAQS